MKPILPVLALLAVCGCASEPPLIPMQEQTDAPETVEPVDVVEPWSNPLKITKGLPTVTRTAQEIIREQNAASRVGVDRGAWKGAKLRYRWVDGESYDITVAKDRTTSLVLFPGEGFNNYSYGDENFGPELEATWAGTRDAKAMPYGPGQTSIPIVPWVGRGCTDLTVYTTWRIILANVCSVPKNAPYNRIVEWWMPGEELRRFSDALASGEVSAPTIEPATGVPHVEVEARYKPNGQAPDGWLAEEWTAFNDGERTYVIPPPGLPFNAVPVVRNAQDGDTPLYRMRSRLDGEGTYYQISALPSEIIMSHGDETMTLRRTK